MTTSRRGGDRGVVSGCAWRLWIMLLCLLLLEETEGRHENFSDAERTVGGQGNNVEVGYGDERRFLK